MQKNNAKGFYRSVLILVVPMALQNLINVAIQSADVIMLGRVGEVVLSAASLAGQIQFVMMLIFFGLASGASVLTAQYWGKGDKRTIEKVLAITLRLSVATSLLFFLAAILIPTFLMRIFSPDPEIIREGASYLRIVSFSYLCMSFTNIYLNIIRSVEKVIFATVVFSISLLTNVCLNAIFIFGLLGVPAMGIKGAALATTLARIIELCIVLVYALRNPLIKLRRRDYLIWNRELFKDFMKYSGPTILNEMLWGLAFSTNAVIIGHLGAAAVAANSVAQVVRQLSMVVCFGIANATAILIGKTIGAGEPDLARTYASRLIKLTFVAGGLGAALVLLIRPFVISAMNLSPQAAKYLGFLLLLMGVYVLAAAYNTTMIVGVFRGGGDTRIGLFLDIGSMWLASLPLGAIAAFVLKLPVEAVYAILMCDEFIKMPFVLLRYKSKRWLRNVTRKEITEVPIPEPKLGE